MHSAHELAPSDSDESGSSDSDESGSSDLDEFDRRSVQCRADTDILNHNYANVNGVGQPCLSGVIKEGRFRKPSKIRLCSTNYLNDSNVDETDVVAAASSSVTEIVTDVPPENGVDEPDQDVNPTICLANKRGRSRCESSEGPSVQVKRGHLNDFKVATQVQHAVAADQSTARSVKKRGRPRSEGIACSSNESLVLPNNKKKRNFPNGSEFNEIDANDNENEPGPSCSYSSGPSHLNLGRRSNNIYKPGPSYVNSKPGTSGNNHEPGPSHIISEPDRGCGVNVIPGPRNTSITLDSSGVVRSIPCSGSGSGSAEVSLDQSLVNALVSAYIDFKSMSQKSCATTNTFVSHMSRTFAIPSSRISNIINEIEKKNNGYDTHTSENAAITVTDERPNNSDEVTNETCIIDSDFDDSVEEPDVANDGCNDIGVIVNYDVPDDVDCSSDSNDASYYESNEKYYETSMDIGQMYRTLLEEATRDKVGGSIIDDMNGFKEQEAVNETDGRHPSENIQFNLVVQDDETSQDTGVVANGVLLEDVPNGTGDDSDYSEQALPQVSTVREEVVVWNQQRTDRIQRLDLTDVEADMLRQIVHRLRAADGRAPTLTQVLAAIRTEMEMAFVTDESLLAALYAVPDWQYLRRMPGRGEYRIVELDSVTRLRCQFLQTMCDIVKTGDEKRVVYVAETWMEPGGLGEEERHTGQHSLSTELFHTPAGFRGRVVVWSAASIESGLYSDLLQGHLMMPNERLCGEELREKFHAWFAKLCDQLHGRSVIVLSTAPHHWTRTLGPMDRSQYAIIRYASQRNHQVIRLPERHCRYNPLEQVWTDTKQQMLSRKMEKSSDMWNNMCKSVLKLFRPLDKWLERVKSVQRVYDTDLTELHQLNSLLKELESDSDA